MEAGGGQSKGFLSAVCSDDFTGGRTPLSALNTLTSCTDGRHAAPCVTVNAVNQQTTTFFNKQSRFSAAYAVLVTCHFLQQVKRVSRALHFICIKQLVIQFLCAIDAGCILYNDIHKHQIVHNSNLYLAKYIINESLLSIYNLCNSISVKERFLS